MNRGFNLTLGTVDGDCVSATGEHTDLIAVEAHAVGSGRALFASADVTVRGGEFTSSDGDAIELDGDGSILVGTYIGPAGGHTVLLSGDHHLVLGCQITDPSLAGDDTADCVNVTGDENMVALNALYAGGAARHAVRVEAGATDNCYVGNFGIGTFGSGAYSDAGTGTQNTWPAAGGDQGDNLVF